MDTPKNVLVIRPEKLGDLVISTPVFRALKHSYPKARISVLTDQVYGEILHNDPNVDDIISIAWKWRDRGQHEPFASVIRKLRPRKYDLALILYPNWSGWNIIAALSGIHRVAQVGGTLAGVLLGHKMIRRRASVRHLHYRDYYLEAAGAAGASLANGDDRSPRLHLDSVSRDIFLSQFPRTISGRRVILHPFGHGSSPNYSVSSYVRLADRLTTDLGIEVWLTGGRSEAAQWPSREVKGIRRDWLGTLSVREMMAACLAVDAVICGSTGVIHLAAALGTPTVGLFCPHPGSHPSAWGPLGDRVTNLVVPDRLCRKLTESKGNCSASNDCDLICGIPVDGVVEAVRRTLQPLPGKFPTQAEARATID